MDVWAGPVTVDATVEAWRAVRAVLAGEAPLPTAGNAQDVISVLALMAAGGLTGQLIAEGVPEAEAPGVALAHAEAQIACLVLDGRVWLPGDAGGLP